MKKEDIIELLGITVGIVVLTRIFYPCIQNLFSIADGYNAATLTSALLMAIVTAIYVRYTYRIFDATNKNTQIANESLLEMKNQRNMANTPRLHVISSRNLISMEPIFIISSEVNTLPVGWKNTKLPIEEKGRNIILEPDLDFLEPIKIVNTGLSPALGVEIKWRLEDEYIKEISQKWNQFCPKIKFEVNRSKEKYEMTVEYRKYSFTQKSINTEYECVLSFSTKEDNKIELHIPRQLYVMKFIEMCGEYVKRGSSSSLGTPPSPQGVYSSESAFNKSSIPLLPLIADITYSDNINLKHKGELYVNFRLVVPNDKLNHEDILFKVGTLIIESELKYN